MKCMHLYMNAAIFKTIHICQCHRIHLKCCVRLLNVEIQD